MQILQKDIHAALAKGAHNSARESRSWYFDGRHVLGNELFIHRGKLLTRIIQLGLTMIPQQRGRAIREENAKYEIKYKIEFSDELLEWQELVHVPLPTFDI